MKFRPFSLTLVGLISFSSFAIAAQAQTPVVPPSANAPIGPEPAPQPVQPTHVQQSAPPPPAQSVPPMPPPPPGQRNYSIAPPQPIAPAPIDLNSPGIEAVLPKTIMVSGIAATVNGVPITYKTLVTKWLAEGATAANFLDELENEELIREQAKKEGISVSPAETAAKLLEAKKFLLPQYPGESWAQFLALQGRSESYIKDNIYDGLLAVKLVEKTMPPPSLAGKVHLYHILKLTVSVPGGASPQSDVQALHAIQAIRDLIVSGKVSFQDEARKESQDSSAAKGGDLGWVGPDAQLDPSFAKAAFALKEGEISQPVKSQYGWHLILAAKMGANASPADIVAYRSSKEEEDRARGQIQSYLKELRSSARIVNYLLPTPPAPRPANVMIVPHPIVKMAPAPVPTTTPVKPAP